MYFYINCYRQRTWRINAQYSTNMRKWHQRMKRWHSWSTQTLCVHSFLRRVRSHFMFFNLLGWTSWSCVDFHSVHFSLDFLSLLTCYFLIGNRWETGGGDAMWTLTWGNFLEHWDVITQENFGFTLWFLSTIMMMISCNTNWSPQTKHVQWCEIIKQLETHWAKISSVKLLFYVVN